MKAEHEQRMNKERSLANLRPMNTLPAEKRREIARLGGLASGARRRHQAELRLAMIETLAGYDLAQETREEYRKAIQWYVKKERKKHRKNERSKNNA